MSFSITRPKAITPGPTLSFRGLENDTYYILDKDRSRYANYSGTGNTLNGNHPIVRRMILDSLRYWVEEMHVDGFRFDLASILDRDDTGNLMPSPPVLWDIDSDPISGRHQADRGGLGRGRSCIRSAISSGTAWREWNGKFRDDVRSFFRGDEGAVGRSPTGCSAALRFTVIRNARLRQASTS
jgi:isoamylase